MALNCLFCADVPLSYYSLTRITSIIVTPCCSIAATSRRVASGSLRWPRSSEWPAWYWQNDTETAPDDKSTDAAIYTGNVACHVMIIQRETDNRNRSPHLTLNEWQRSFPTVATSLTMCCFCRWCFLKASLLAYSFLQSSHEQTNFSVMSGLSIHLFIIINFIIHLLRHFGSTMFTLCLRFRGKWSRDTHGRIPAANCLYNNIRSIEEQLT